MSVKRLSGNCAAGHAFPLPDRKENDIEGVGWLGAITIGGIAGWLAETVMGGDRGILTNTVPGILGALVVNAIRVLFTGAP